MHQATARVITTAQASAHSAGITPTPKRPGTGSPSAAARAESASSTTGVARPSLSPLSTFSPRRTRNGTTGLSTVAAPRPASVGVMAAAISTAPATPTAGSRLLVTR